MSHAGEDMTIGTASEDAFSDTDSTQGTHADNGLAQQHHRVPHQPIATGSNSSIPRGGSSDAFPLRAMDSHEPTATGASHVLTNNRSPSTTGPPQNTSFANPPPSQQQPPMMSDQQAAAIGQSLMHALSGEDMLEDFLRKYPRPTPGSGVGVGPIKSTTQGKDAQGRERPPDYHVKKRAAVREKRRRLRDLQQWECDHELTPPRRANAAVIGLLTFGMTFILFGLHYTGHFDLDTVVPAMAINVGGGLQMIAGFLCWVQGLTFAYVSFVTSGAFFLGITCVWMLPNSSFVAWSGVSPSSDYLAGAFYIIWGIMNFFFFLCTLRMNLCIILKLLSTCIALLCIGGGMMSGHRRSIHVGGYFAIIGGGASMYLSCASLVNEVWDQYIFPVFQVTTLLDMLGGKSKMEEEKGGEEKQKSKRGSLSSRSSAVPSRNTLRALEEEEAAEEAAVNPHNA